MKKFQEKTNEEKYLEWLNDWLTLDRMAEYYSLTPAELLIMIDKGRDEHNAKFA